MGDTTYKLHLDGYNLLPALKSEGAWPRHEFLYWSDDGNIAALQYPFERAEYEAMDYGHWFVDHMFVFTPAGTYVGKWLQSLWEFPPRQKPGSFNLERVMEQVTGGTGKRRQLRKRASSTP